MCLGAVVWSGVQTLVCGATDGDARAIGFDEGPKPPDWVSALYQRGIAVHREVLRPDAAGVLQAYADAGGPIYNARRCLLLRPRPLSSRCVHTRLRSDAGSGSGRAASAAGLGW